MVEQEHRKSQRQGKMAKALKRLKNRSLGKGWGGWHGMWSDRKRKLQQHQAPHGQSNA